MEILNMFTGLDKSVSGGSPDLTMQTSEVRPGTSRGEQSGITCLLRMLDTFCSNM